MVEVNTYKSADAVQTNIYISINPTVGANREIAHSLLVVLASPFALIKTNHKSVGPTSSSTYSQHRHHTHTTTPE